MRDATGRWGRVLVLGGSSEIGLAIVQALDLRPGCEIVLAGRDTEGLEAVHLPAAARRSVVPWDAADSAAGASLVERVTSSGDIDLVVVAVGLLGRGAETQAALAHDVLTTNLLGVVDVLIPIGEAMREQGHGTVVVLSSVAAMRPRKSNYVYGASKAGLDAFARGMADSLKPDGVEVVVVRPGFVQGRMTEGLPAAPLSTSPDAVALCVRRALSRGRTTVWAPGALAALAPALQLVPRRLWRRLDL